MKYAYIKHKNKTKYSQSRIKYFKDGYVDVLGFIG